MNHRPLQRTLRRPLVQALVLFLSGVASAVATSIIIAFLTNASQKLVPVQYTLTNFGYGMTTLILILLAIMLFATGLVLVGMFYRSIGYYISYRALGYAAVTAMFGGLLALMSTTGPAFQQSLSPSAEQSLAIIFGSSFGFLFLFSWRLGMSLAAADEKESRVAAKRTGVKKPRKRTATNVKVTRLG
jgi:hypothetical protein